MLPTRTTSRSKTRPRPFAPGDFVLLDMWAKLDQPGAVYYDITWTGFCGDNPSDAMLNVFGVVTGARDAAFAAFRRP